MLPRILKNTAVILAMAVPAQAGDLIVGIGATDFTEDFAKNDFQLTLEYSGATVARRGQISFHPGVAIDLDGNGDYWVGAGVHATRPIGRGPWMLEASLMPGFYKEAIKANELGGNLQFRTLIGLGYSVSESLTLSIAASHKSNAGTNENNPGANAFTLRFRRGF